MKSNLTKRTVNALSYKFEPGSKRAHYVWDTKLVGFGLRCYPSGRKAYLITYRNAAGQKRFYTFGDHGPWTPDKARDKAGKLLRRVDDGEDPSADRNKLRETPTVAKAFEMFIEEHSKPRKKSWQRDDQAFRHQIEPAFGRRKVTSITTDDLTQWHTRIGVELSHGTANRTLAVVSKFFSFCELKGWITKGSNPARGVQRFRTKPRNAWVKPDQLPALIAAINAENGRTVNDTIGDRLIRLLDLSGQPMHVTQLVRQVGHPHKKVVQLLALLAKNDPRVERVKRGEYQHTGRTTPELEETAEAPYLRAFFWCALLTGARKGELLGLTWDNVDLVGATATLRDRKGGDDLTIPLSPPVVTVLSNLERQTKNPYVFAATRRKGQAITNVSKAWARIRARAGLSSDIRLHDLRRSFASYLAAAGVPILVTKTALGHSSVKVTESVYSRLQLDPIRRAMDDLARTVTAAGEPGNVVDLDAERSRREGGRR